MKYGVETNNGKHVFSTGMANYLLQRGHKLLAIKDNTRVQNASVFLYENTPALLQDMEQYKETSFRERQAREAK